MEIMKASDRKPEIQRLRAEGESYTRIAEIIGVTRQRIHQIDTGYSSYKPKRNWPKREERMSRREQREQRDREYQLYLQQLKRGSHFA